MMILSTNSNRRNLRHPVIYFHVFILYFQDPNLAEDFADLPIAQRIKKYKKKIKELQDQISHDEKSM